MLSGTLLLENETVMAHRREKGSGIVPKAAKKKLKEKRYRQMLKYLPIVKTIVIYFCIPFTFALSLALFLTSPRPELSGEVADWRDSGYPYDFNGKEVFYRGNYFGSLIIN